MAPSLYLTALLFTQLLGCRAGTVHKNNAQLSADLSEDSDLLDVVLVASVDGKLYALNRSTGSALWSMASLASSSVSRPSTAPLVHTNHIDHDPDDTAYQETYIIEPQSGDIYVMATPSAPLQRFPFTMSELVDMSPFSFAAANDHRVFVGRKETSLLLVDLETGNITATRNPACPWHPFEHKLDLDKLGESERTEVFIGRTDYHIAIHGRSRIPVQHLSFSTYGPNNQDNPLQAAYRKPKDDTIPPRTLSSGRRNSPIPLSRYSTSCAPPLNTPSSSCSPGRSSPRSSPSSTTTSFPTSTQRTSACSRRQAVYSR
ncbi:hypothetical protein C8F04DRAFT_696772 [Mycena alexandri]|uniref:ER membrane protein complex subunit 1 n=1 Tax=Mycena alexandri TaxID=1745969 RepID=A0AAD6SQ42_9AGAR|nr:hypothetical protein C8F04DRAFT_696772 [Mycena alexandri]